MTLQNSLRFVVSLRICRNPRSEICCCCVSCCCVFAIVFVDFYFIFIYFLWILVLLFLFVGGMMLFLCCCFFRVRVCMRVDFKINTFVKVKNLYILRLSSTF